MPLLTFAGSNRRGTVYGLYRDGSELRGIYTSKPQLARAAYKSLGESCDYPILLGSSLKFIPGVPVMGSGSAEFLDIRSALASPLAIRLMGIQGVTGVFYGPDFVTVSKDSENPWAVLKPEIYSTLMEHFTSQTPLFRSEEDRANAGPQDTRITEDDTETVAMIKELLDTRV